MHRHLFQEKQWSRCFPFFSFTFICCNYIFPFICLTRFCILHQSLGLLLATAYSNYSLSFHIFVINLQTDFTSSYYLIWRDIYINSYKNSQSQSNEKNLCWIIFNTNLQCLKNLYKDSWGPHIIFWRHSTIAYFQTILCIQVDLRPCQTSMMQLFCGNSKWLLRR